MKKNNGFTLIELLAVIVILAIIALIATPIIVGVIEDAQVKANTRTIEGYAKAVEYAYVACLFENPTGTDCTTSGNLDANITYTGATVTCGTRTFSPTATGANKTLFLATCAINGGSSTYGYSNGEVTNS